MRRERAIALLVKRKAGTRTHLPTGSRVSRVSGLTFVSDDVRPVSDPISANTGDSTDISWPAVLAGVSKRSPVGGNVSGPVVTVLRAAFGKVVVVADIPRWRSVALVVGFGVVAWVQASRVGRASF